MIDKYKRIFQQFLSIFEVWEAIQSANLMIERLKSS